MLQSSICVARSQGYEIRTSVICPFASVTVTWNVYGCCAADVGKLPMSPVGEIVMPVGSVPPDCVNVYGCVPPAQSIWYE